MTQPLSPLVAYLTDFPDQVDVTARLVTAGWLVRGVSAQLHIPYADVAAALDTLPINLGGLLDSPQGLSMLGGYLASVLGNGIVAPNDTSIH